MRLNHGNKGGGMAEDKGCEAPIPQHRDEGGVGTF